MEYVFRMLIYELEVCAACTVFFFEKGLRAKQAPQFKINNSGFKIARRSDGLEPVRLWGIVTGGKQKPKVQWNFAVLRTPLEEAGTGEHASASPIRGAL